MTYGYEPDGAFSVTATPADVAARIQQIEQRRAEENLAWTQLKRDGFDQHAAEALAIVTDEPMAA